MIHSHTNQTKSIKSRSLLIIFCFLAVFAPITAAAQGEMAPNTPLDIAKIFSNVTDVLWAVAWSLVIIVFIWAGIKYLLTKGDPGEIEKANRMIIWGVVGTAVIVLAWSFESLVRWILGI